MQLISQQYFAPIHMYANDSLSVTYSRFDVDIVTCVLPKKVRHFNVLRVYEAVEFEGLSNVVLAILGWDESGPQLKGTNDNDGASAA